MSLVATVDSVNRVEFPRRQHNIRKISKEEPVILSLIHTHVFHFIMNKANLTDLLTKKMTGTGCNVPCSFSL